MVINLFLSYNGYITKNSSNTFIISWTDPKPKRIPVINLLVLFDMILKNSCAVPSSINGKRKDMQIILDIKRLEIDSRNANR